MKFSAAVYIICTLCYMYHICKCKFIFFRFAMNVLSKLEKEMEEVVLNANALSLMDLPNEMIEHMLEVK